MSSTILLIILSAHITGLISEQLLRAAVGGSILIPCSLHDNRTLSRFYWQEGEQHFFRWDSGKIIQIPNNTYENRTQVFHDEFSSGNISFRLDNISLEDDRKTFFAYIKFDKEKQSEERCRSRLQVSAPYQDLVLMVNHTTNSATCSARGGYPAAQVSWKGLNRSSDEELDLQDAETFPQSDPTEKTFSFTSSVNVTGLKSVTCVVYNPHSNKTITRTEKIDTESINVAAIVVPVVVFIILAGVLAGLCCWYKKKPPAPGQAQAPAPVPANQSPVDPNTQDGAQAEGEAADAPEDTVLTSEDRAAFHRRTRTSEGTADRDTCEDAAASPEKEKLLKKENGTEDRASD